MAALVFCKKTQVEIAGSMKKKRQDGQVIDVHVANMVKRRKMLFEKVLGYRGRVEKSMDTVFVQNGKCYVKWYDINGSTGVFLMGARRSGSCTLVQGAD